MCNRTLKSPLVLVGVAVLLAVGAACQRRERGYEKPAPVNPAVAGSAQRPTAEGARPAQAATTTLPTTASGTSTASGSPKIGGIGGPLPVRPTTSEAAAQAAGSAWPRPARGKMISLIYGGNREGEIEPCG